MDLPGCFSKRVQIVSFKYVENYWAAEVTGVCFFLPCSSEIPKNAVCSILVMDHKFIISFSIPSDYVLYLLNCQCLFNETSQSFNGGWFTTIPIANCTPQSNNLSIRRWTANHYTKLAKSHFLATKWRFLEYWIRIR